MKGGTPVSTTKMTRGCVVEKKSPANVFHASLRITTLVILLTSLLTTCEGVNTKPSLNARRVLLPYNLDVPTNFTLEALDGGCYKWSSSRSDVASVTLIIDSESTETECSSRAVVTAVSRSKRRQAAVILAMESGVTLRADVEVDSIKSIEIITTTREIALDDVPEIFEVHAKNDQNNTFTCLGGIEFEWDLKPIMAVTSSKVNDAGDTSSEISNLRFRKFSELSYKLDKQGEHEYWEERDRRGSIVLIEGVKTGASRVIAKIKDPSYNEVLPSEIQLLVIANIYLVPSDMVYLIPQATIAYSVNILKGQQMRELALPTEQYYLDVLDTKVASLDAASSTLTASKEGSTSIVLKDRNIKPGIGLRQPTAEVNVMKPSYMSFHVEPGTPGKEWTFQAKTQYIISLTVYDTQHHKMYPSPNLGLKVVFSSKFFTVESSTANGTYHVVTALQPGSTIIKATLEGAYKPDGTVVKLLPKALTAEQEVNIYPELIVAPTTVFLPWDQNVKPIYTLKPMASGGTGSYRWDSSNTGLVGVNHATGKESAKPRVMTKGRGLTKLTVRDASSNVFVKQIPIEVTDIIEMKAINGISETPLGSSVFVHLALYGKSEDESYTDMRLFDDCSQIPVDVDIVEKTRFTYNEVTKGDVFVDKRACRVLEFTCTGVGHSRIWISYQSPNGLVNINTTSMISCFLPLKIVHPGKQGLLALGTSVEVTFEGGPRKWPLNNEGYYSTLNAADSKLFAVKPILDPYRYKKDLHVFRVTCQELGETTLNLRVGNLASATLPSPAILEEHVKITCANPVALTAKPKLKNDDSCPLLSRLASNSKYPVSDSNPIELEINAKDVAGNDFLNISSFNVVWSLSDNIIARMPINRDFKEEVNGAGGFRRWTRNYQVVNPNKKEGEVIVTAKAVSYRPEVLSAEGASSSYRNFDEIRTDIRLTLVDKPKIDPQEATLFNHKDNLAVLHVIKGSGHFKVIVNPNDVTTANITYNDALRQVTVKPLADGLVSVRVVDSCVVHDPGTTSPDAEAFVRVVDPRSIRVSLNEKIELGKETDVKVEVIDSSGGVIPFHFHSLMNLHPIVRSDIVSVKLVSPVKEDKHSIYRIKAEKLGRAGLVFATGSTDKTTLYSNVIESSEVKLEVFSPLVVSPVALKLIVGSQFEVSVTGGPQPESTLEFSTSNSNIASVGSSGLLEAKTLGTFSLTSKSVGHNNIVYSQDSVPVEVVPLHGIKIVSPLKQVVAGSEVSMILYGIGPKGEELDPLSFGSANPRLKITWTVSNSQLLDVVSVPSKLGVYEPSPNDFSVRVRGNREGTAIVKVTVEVTEERSSSNQYQIQDNLLLSDNITLRVFASLKSNDKPSEQLIMTPGSELKLSSSRDGIAKVTYSIRGGSNKIILEKNGALLRSLSSDASEAVLEVKSTETHGVSQVAAYGIQVQAIAFMMLVPERTLFTNPDSSRKLTSIPVGATLRFNVNFYNVLGQKFDVVNLKPQVRFNRYGLLGYSWTSTDNGQLAIVLTALKEGTTIIKVWVDGQSQEISDFIHIQVGQVIRPVVSDITVGDVVCFSSPLTTPEGQNGSWSEDISLDTGILDFLPGSSGVAIARNAGVVKVKQDISSFKTISNPISVVPNQGIYLEARHLHFISNSNDADIFLPMIVGQSPGSGSASTKRLTPVGCSKNVLESINSPFVCFVKFTEGESLLKAADVYSCSVVLCPDVTNSHCVHLKLKKDITHEKQHTASSIKSLLEVSVKLTKSNIRILPTTFPFHAAFFIHDKEILLTNQEPLQYIILTGTAAVLKDLRAETVNEETKRLIDVFPPEVLKDSAGEVTGLQVPLQLKGKLDSLWQTTHHGLGVKVWSPLTTQGEVVSIGVKWNFQEGSQCIKLSRSPLYDSRTVWDVSLDLFFAPFIFLYNNFHVLITIICFVLIAVVTVLYWTKARPQPVNPHMTGSYHQPTFEPTGSPSRRQLFSTSSSPFGSSVPIPSAVPFGRTLNTSTTLTNRRIFDTSSLASSPSRAGSDPDLISSTASFMQSPSRPTSSPKGVIGRPLWSHQN